MLGQPLQMATHVSDWEFIESKSCGGKRNTMATMFVGGVELMLDGILVLFLP